MKSALVTGANKGIGLEVAKQLAQNGYSVYMGSRNLEKGVAAAQHLKSQGINNITAIQLDVTNPESVAAAHKAISEKTAMLDVLVNNAGISGAFQQSALDSTVGQFQEVYETNLFGVIRVTQAFIGLLKNATAPRIVNVSTSMASLTLAADLTNSTFPTRYAMYQSSKSALNMYTINLAYELRDTSFKINAVCPGWTQTDFTNHQGTSTAAEAGERIAKYAMIGNDGPTGGFFSEEYFPAPQPCPW